MARPPRLTIPPTVVHMRLASQAKKRNRTMYPFRRQLLAIIAELGAAYAATTVILSRYNETAKTPTTLQTLDITLKALEATGYVSARKGPSLLRASQPATFYTLTEQALALLDAA